MDRTLLRSLAIGAGAALIAWGAAIWLKPVPQHQSPNETIAIKSTTELKADKEPPPAPPDYVIPKIVHTVPVAPLFQPLVSAPQFEAMPKLVEQQQEAPTPPEPEVHGDICQKHGGYRVTEGKKWRCVFPNRR